MTENANNDPIGKALGVTPIENIENKIESINNLIKDSHNDSAAKDFEVARANIHEIIEDGKEALFKLSEISSSSQHPRSFEVYAKLMETLINANEKLLELQLKIRNISSIDEPLNSQAKTINNNLFVGSTAELQKMLLDMRNNNETD